MTESGLIVGVWIICIILFCIFQYITFFWVFCKIFERNSAFMLQQVQYMVESVSKNEIIIFTLWFLIIILWEIIAILWLILIIYYKIRGEK